MYKPRFVQVCLLGVAALVFVGCGGGGGGGTTGGSGSGSGGGTGGTATFTPMGDLAGANFSSGVQGLNSNGTVAVGFGTPTPPNGQSASNNAAMWTSGGGIVALSGVGPGTAFGVSSDGSVVVGTHQIGLITGFSWTAGGGVVDLPELSGATAATQATDVSSDGTVIAGQGFDSSNQQRGIRWEGGAATALNPLAGGSFSFATAVSGDGNVIVGESGASIGARAVRWVGNTGASSLGVLSGGTQSLAHDVNTNGSVIVGESGTTAGGTHTSAFRWTLASGTMTDLGSLPGSSKNSRAYAVSGDGSVVVGESQTGATGQDTSAFIWTQAGGMKNLQTLLSNNGASASLAGWVLLRATAISADGKVVGGIGLDPDGFPEGWTATLP